MNPLDQLKTIYINEVNLSISTFWDGGYTVKMGDALNGYTAEKSGFYSPEEAIDWAYREMLKIVEAAQIQRESDKKLEAVD